ncbi:MAG: translocation/assembly module TamB [Acidobacteria bacterium]|nr:translocation/assembly module TamB [Acidobacteriota bacterium]
MKRLRKWLVRGLIALLVLAALLSVSFFVVLRSQWLREEARSRIIRETERATGGKVELKKFDFNPRTMEFTVEDFILRGKEAAGEPPLAHVAKIHVGAKVISFFRRDAYLAALDVEGAQVRIVTYPDGTTNIPGPQVKRDSAKSPFEQFVALAARSFSLKDGYFEYDNRRVPVNLRAENLRVDFSWEREGTRYRGTVSAKPFHFHWPKVDAMSFDTEVQVAMDKTGLTFEKSEIRKGNSLIQATGRMEDYRAPKLSIDGKAHLMVADFGAALRLPVAREGFVDYQGNLSYAAGMYLLEGHATGTGLAIRESGWEIAGIGLKTDVRLEPNLVTFRQLSGTALGGAFQGEAAIRDWRSFQVKGAVTGLSLEQVQVLGRVPKPLAWSSLISGPVEVSGEFAPKGVAKLALASHLVFEPKEGKIPLEGLLKLQYGRDRNQLAFSSSYFKTPRSRVDFTGGLQDSIQVIAETTDANDFLPAVSLAMENAPSEMPVQLDGGEARFEGVVRNPMGTQTVQGTLSATQFVVEKRKVDSASADIDLDAGRVIAKRLLVQQNGSQVSGEAQVALSNWRASAESALTATLDLRGASLEQLLKGRELPVSIKGVASGPVEIRGTVGDPAVTAKLQLANVQLDDEPFPSIRFDLRFGPGVVELTSGEAVHAGGRIPFQAKYEHPKDEWDNGTLTCQVSAKDAALSSINTYRKERGEIDGRLDLDASAKLRIEKSRPLIDFISGGLHLRNITANKKPVGALRVTAATRGERINVEADGDLLGSPIHGKGEWQLTQDAAGLGHIELGTLTLAKVNQLLQAAGSARTLPLEGNFKGEVVVSGPLRKWNAMSARINLTNLQLQPIIPEKTQLTPAVMEELTLRNTGPIILEADSRGLQIVQGTLVGKETNITMAGHIATAARQAWNVEMRGSLNLAIFSNTMPGLRTSGAAVVNAAVRGTLEQPQLGGRMEIRAANLTHRELTNSIENATGIVVFDRNRALLQNFTALSGGGEVKLSGFVAFGGEETITYRLNGLLERVRVRYPEGTSNTVNANLSLTGTSDQSLLAGTVTVLRSGFNTRTDIASTLLEHAKPVQTPTSNALLRGMTFDVRVVSGPNLQLETSLTQGTQASVDLRLRGSLLKPVLLGSVAVNQGDLNFLGTTYRISRGTVSFFNAARIEPVLDLDLETTVRAVTVNMTISGPVDKPNITYRSDPPLQTADIIALLAVGRTPTTGSAVAATQTNIGGTGSGFFAGTDTLVGQAVSAGLSSRLQRFFGVSRVKIDPQLLGVESTPQARLTIEQQISRDITLTYVTNLTGALQQLVRLQWDFKRNWSITMIKDENGVLGGDIQYRKRFK